MTPMEVAQAIVGTWLVANKVVRDPELHYPLEAEIAKALKAEGDRWFREGQRDERDRIKHPSEMRV